MKKHNKTPGISIKDVMKAREFVKEMGTIEKAAASIVALGRFKGHTTPNAPQPQREENNTEIQAEQHKLITWNTKESDPDNPAEIDLGLYRLDPPYLPTWM